MQKSHINLIGFEVEGGWAGSKYVSPFSDGTLIVDSSINGQRLKNSPPISATHIGEVVSPPLPLSVWKEWLTNHWPDAKPPNRTNRTCGFHIHISVHNLRDYSLLTAKGFLFGVRDKMTEVGKELNIHSQHVFWERMLGLNNFCKLEFSPDKQIALVKGLHHGNPNRYGYLNFAYNVHGTVEFRALPTFRDSHVASRFAEEYFAYVDSYLEEVKDIQVQHSTRLVG